MNAAGRGSDTGATFSWECREDAALGKVNTSRSGRDTGGCRQQNQRHSFTSMPWPFLMAPLLNQCRDHAALVEKEKYTPEDLKIVQTCPRPFENYERPLTSSKVVQLCPSIDQGLQVAMETGDVDPTDLSWPFHCQRVSRRRWNEAVVTTPRAKSVADKKG
ncbi:hypothetical protein PIB30_077986 [Stylosanthes scabra]|uniref:Uncharacterized protein n=1 Tax=Stylosanthes scabra TaxID=79078 RepID=A0ABU6ZPC4_9FABA|nr:hypothetical protein [Stylosanthes scabra]